MIKINETKRTSDKVLENCIHKLVNTQNYKLYSGNAGIYKKKKYSISSGERFDLTHKISYDEYYTNGHRLEGFLQFIFTLDFYGKNYAHFIGQFDKSTSEILYDHIVEKLDDILLRAGFVDYSAGYDERQKIGIIDYSAITSFVNDRSLENYLIKETLRLWSKVSTVLDSVVVKSPRKRGSRL